MALHKCSHLLVCQLDLPLSLVFYKWLLGLESTLTLSDVHHVDPVLATSLQQLHDVVIQKKNLEADVSHVRKLTANLKNFCTFDAN